MKKILLIVSLMFVMGCGSWSCSSTNKSIVAYDHITAQAMKDSCTLPDEVHEIHPGTFPIYARVIRHSDCLGLSDVLMVTFPGDVSDKNTTAAKLLMLMYVEFQNEKMKDYKMTGKFLKIDSLEQSNGMIIQIAFYELKTSPVAKTSAN